MENGLHMLKVGDFVLNTDSRKLYNKEKKEVSLPPTLFTLLKFFIDHQNQVCSKDMIIDNVWKGKIVVEANVNQNIKKLRDVLGDSANDPKYIETVTGEGFRFIANSEEYKATPADYLNIHNKLKLAITFLLVLFIFAISYFFGYKNKNDAEQVNNLVKELHPLTTLKGLEHYPYVTKDKKFLIFSHKNNDNWNIFYKPLNKESYHPITANQTIDERFPALSPDQSTLLYYAKGEKKCGLYKRFVNLEENKIGDEYSIKLCLNSSERLRGEWIDNENLFISIHEDLNSPASIYEFNITTGQQKLISKPDIKGFGDYAFKYSSKHKMLAYVRNIGWSSSEIWIYSLEDKSHKKIKSIPIMLGDLDWFNEDWIIYQSGNKQVSMLSLDGSKDNVLAEFLTNVYLPFSIDSNTIGVVMGDYSVIDIGEFDVDSGKMSTIVSSSFNDYLGASANNFISFVSNRSGNPQIWVRDSDGNYSQITRFEKTYEISGLSVSKKNNIIFNKSGQINIIDKKGSSIYDSKNYYGQVQDNPVLDEVNNRFFYSIQRGGEWNIETKSISSASERTILFKGTSARPCINDNCILYFREGDPFLYKYLSDKNTSVQVAKIGYIETVSEWDTFDEEHILYLEKNDPKNKIFKFNIKTGKKQLILESNGKTFSFDKHSRQIYVNIVSQGNTDMVYFTL